MPHRLRIRFPVQQFLTLVCSRGQFTLSGGAAILTEGSAPVVPFIVTQPSSVTVTEPASATFTVFAGGTAPLSYQWQRNSVDISGATSSSYTLSPTATTDTGAVFRCVVTNAYGSVTSNAVALTVAAASVGVTLAFSSSEGYVTTNGLIDGPRPRLSRGQMYYESAYTTKDGTIIEHADGAHGRVLGGAGYLKGTSNRVGEFDPLTGSMTEVFPDNWEDHGTTSYDNLIYLYFDAIDSLVLFSDGVYDRTITDTMSDRVWTGSETVGSWSGDASLTGTSSWKYRNPNGGAVARFDRATNAEPPPAGRPPVHTDSATTNALIYVPSNLAGYEEHIGWFNVHCAYSRQFDCAVIIGGASATNQVENCRLTIIIPSAIYGTGITPRYTARHAQYSKTTILADGARWMMSSGRAACKFLNNYVYWAGGDDQHQSPGAVTPAGSSSVKSFFRANIAPVLASPTAALSTTFLPERLPDMPAGFTAGCLSADPFSNTILAFSKQGIFLYDPTAGDWSSYGTRGGWTNVTTQFSEYVSTFGGGNYITFAHADFVNYRGSTQLRKTYFWGGWNGLNVAPDNQPGTSAYGAKYERVRSVKVTRTGTVSYLNLTAANPESPATNYGNLFQDIKHQGLIVSGTGASRTLTLLSGDFSGYPSNTSATSGYKAEGIYQQDGRQDIWRASIGTSEIASGSIRFSMVSNAYAAYPWNGTAGVNAGATKGPAMMDALGAVVDSRGQWWVGPCDGNDYNSNIIEARGQTLSYAPMYKWTPPGTNSTGFGVSGVALGNGWELPTQDRLIKPGAGGTLGVDHDISSSGASDGHGWGRTNARGSMYDATNDRIYVVSVGVNGSAKTFSVQLYGFNPDPADAAVAGKYAWTKSTLITKNIREYGGPADNQYTGCNMSGWGDNLKGTINCAPQLIGRKLYFAALWGYTGVTNGLTANRPEVGSHCRAHLYSLNVDTLALEWIPLPENQNWWLRAWDGPNSVEGGVNNEALTPAQSRCLACIGDKLILGPDSYTKIGVDPWCQVYDTTRKVWTSFQPPTDNDWPSSPFSMVAVPDLGEIWLMGQVQSIINGSIRVNNGLHNPPTNAGRRIVRLKVT